MKQKKIFLMIAALASALVATKTAPSQASSINFDFSSTSSSGVRGRITFDNTAIIPGQLPDKPTVATYLGAIQSYEITDGINTFVGSEPFVSSNQIHVYDNIIDINDPYGRTYLGDGLEFVLGDWTSSVFLRFLYPENTTLNSLSLSEISLQNNITAYAPQLPLEGGGALSTILQVSSSGRFVIQDGTYWDSEFMTSISPVSNSIPEPTSVIALGFLTGTFFVTRKKVQK